MRIKRVTAEEVNFENAQKVQFIGRFLEYFLQARIFTGGKDF